MLLSSGNVVHRTNIKKLQSDHGFTLIELIVVTTLIAIMLSMSIPSLRDAFFTDPLKTTTRKIIGLVTGVRELAVRSQQPYLLYISQLENRIWYEQDNGERDNDERYKASDLDDKNKDVLLKREFVFPDSVKITGIVVEGDNDSTQGQTVVWINKQGYMGDILLRIEDDAGNKLNVQFYPFLKPVLLSDKAAGL